MTLRTLIPLLTLLTVACRDKDNPADDSVYPEVDVDGDGFSSEEDCDDEDASINPGAPELCDSLDNDCDEEIDEEPVDGLTFYTDRDGDGFGDDATPLLACTQPSGSATLGGDCDDRNNTYFPGATEDDCTDPNDYNCDGSVGYSDGDGDGFPACEECDDSSATISPNADELCNSADDDCDGEIDEGDAIDGSLWYLDADGDGFGNPDVRFAATACAPPEGYVGDNTDCDDLDASVNPDTTWYRDADTDGYGDPTVTFVDCEQPAGHVLNSEDCDDTDTTLNPETVWYQDKDGDGYGVSSSTTRSCTEPSGYAAFGDDCLDSNTAVNPGANERCDGVDNDCDAQADESDAVDARVWYSDVDGDSFGDPSTALNSCEQPEGYLSDSSDCDDTNIDVNPGSNEICNDSVDNDCDGVLGPCTQSLSSADALIAGESSYSGAGSEVTYAGDVDGDGYGDIWVGASSDDTNGTDAGAIYLMNGPISSGTLLLSSASAKLTGAADDQAARFIGGNQDLNGDGFVDVVVSAHRNDGNRSAGSKAGAAYVIFGPVTGTSTLKSAADLSFTGEKNFDRLGIAAVLSPDASGDGQTDLLLGAPYHDPTTSLADGGALYLWEGPLSASSSWISSSTADLKLTGEAAGDGIGDRVELGDLDGDGVDDLIIGTQLSDLNGASSGAVYLVMGGLSGTVSLSAADVTLMGESTGDGAGQAVAYAGDMDGDGMGDFLVGAAGDDDGGSQAGTAYLISGTATDGATLSSNLAKFVGESTNDAAGNQVAGNGDFDGDGNLDLVVAASDEGLLDEGAVYLFLGPVTGTYSLGDADARWDGDGTDDGVGNALRFVPDMAATGDGYEDLFIGASAQDASGTDSGALYLLLGLGL